MKCYVQLRMEEYELLIAVIRLNRRMVTWLSAMCFFAFVLAFVHSLAAVAVAFVWVVIFAVAIWRPLRHAQALDRKVTDIENEGPAERAPGRIRVVRPGDPRVDA